MPPSFRSYDTNLDFEPTLKSLVARYAIGDVTKGRVTFRLPIFRENPIQITTGGKVMIFGTSKEIDERILGIIGEDVTTSDSELFHWSQSKRVLSEKELLELLRNSEVEVQRKILETFLDWLERDLQQFPSDSSAEEVKNGRELLAELRNGVRQMDTNSILSWLPQVRRAIMALEYLIDLVNDPSVWYVPESD